MKSIYEFTRNFYQSDEYIIKNPSLHEEDSPWKISKIIPIIDKLFINNYFINKDEINLLDVGGGAGLILSATSAYIEEKYTIKVNKFAIDLSPRMLEIQKKRNPDVRKILNEDIRKTSFGNKEIDIILMIDVLEHVPNPEEALEEVKRIAKFAIFKVPLEDCLLSRTLNFVKKGELRRSAIETVGHINIYDIGRLRCQIEKHTGQLLDCYYANVFDYVRNSDYYKGKMTLKDKLAPFMGAYIFKLSPRFCSIIFFDFAMVLVKCY